MPNEEPPPDACLGVELFTEGDLPDQNFDEEYAPASGGGRASWGGWRPARVTQLGPDALHTSARLVGQQVGAVVRETLAGMDHADLADATAAGLRPSSIQLSFGVKLTAGTGKAIEAVVTAGGEASVQVLVTLDRAD